MRTLALALLFVSFGLADEIVILPPDREGFSSSSGNFYAVVEMFKDFKEEAFATRSKMILEEKNSLKRLKNT